MTFVSFCVVICKKKYLVTLLEFHIVHSPVRSSPVEREQNIKIAIYVSFQNQFSVCVCDLLFFRTYNDREKTMDSIKGNYISLKKKIEKVSKVIDKIHQCAAEPGCTYSQTRFIPRNFARHIGSFHPKVYNLLELGEPVPEDGEKKRNVKSMEEPTDYVLVRIKKQRVVGGAIKLVTKHGLPFNSLNWEGMKDILNHQLSAFKINLNNKNIPRLIGRVRDSVDDIIRDEVNGNFVSLKFDIVSKHNRSFLGTNVQFYKNTELCKRTLGKYTI